MDCLSFFTVIIPTEIETRFLFITRCKLYLLNKHPWNIFCLSLKIVPASFDWVYRQLAWSNQESITVSCPKIHHIWNPYHCIKETSKFLVHILHTYIFFMWKPFKNLLTLGFWYAIGIYHRWHLSWLNKYAIYLMCYAKTLKKPCNQNIHWR